MAKKTNAEKPAIKKETKVVEPVAVNEPVPVFVEKQEPKKPKWEIKDRVYYLKGRKKPLSRTVRSSGIYYFDEEKGYERELKYCQNQITPFVDEMKGDQRLSHIIFRNGALFVPRNEQTLQKLLSLYHPHKENLYYEWKPVEVAENQLEVLEMEIEALDMARSLDLDRLEAILRAEVGSSVAELSSKELKRDALLFARKNASLF